MERICQFGKGLAIFFACGAVLAFGSPMQAAVKEAAFPSRPIRLLLPYPAGSEDDLRSRRLVPALEKHIGSRLVLHNRPGAEGRLALSDTWLARPDGYTVVSTGLPGPLISEKLYSVKYRTTGFSHVFAWSRDNICVVAKEDVYKTAREFLEEVRERSLTAGIVGFGNLSEIAGLSLVESAGLQPVYWRPFKNTAEIRSGLMGDHIDFALTTVSSARKIVEGGQLRVPIVLSSERSPLFPQAALPKDLGFHFTPMPMVQGILAPRGLPSAIADKLMQAVVRAVNEPAFAAWAKSAGIDIVPLNRRQFLDYTVSMEKEIEKYIRKMAVKR